MLLLALDVGSSSVKAGLLKDGKLLGKPARKSYPTHRPGNRAEVNPDEILRAIAKTISSLGKRVKNVDCIAIDAMAPSWLAMDKNGKPLTPIITHQDRRSISVAEALEKSIGKSRCLQLSGNRPVPGGISSTTAAWFVRNEKSTMRRADLVGHFTTFLLRHCCGSRITDPSNASFMGIYSTTTQGGWNDELCDAVGVSKKWLPEIRQANEVGGKLLPTIAREWGVRTGTPMLSGIVDTSGAMLLAGAKVGQLVNVVGTTDVLALCTNHPKPNEHLLLRALGVEKKWVSVFTIAAAGASLTWAKQNLFTEWSERKFFNLVDSLTENSGDPYVKFDPYLAGDRAAIEQKRGGFTGITLSTTREQMLAAIVEALATLSAKRLDLLKKIGTPMRKKVLVSGGGNGALAKLMHRDWNKKWKFQIEDEATLRGLAVLAANLRR